MSADLQWLLIRKWNSFMRPAANGSVFSSEKVRNCSKIDRARTFGGQRQDGFGRAGLVWGWAPLPEEAWRWKGGEAAHEEALWRSSGRCCSPERGE